MAQRPHAIGLLASPIFKKTSKVLTEIEQLSICRMFVVEDTIEELKKFIFRAEPIYYNYDPHRKALVP